MEKLQRELRRVIVPVMVGIVALILAVAGRNEPVIGFLKDTALASLLYSMHIGNLLLSDLAIGVFSGLFVWFFVVYTLEQKKRKTLRTSMDYRYRAFREALLANFLAVSLGTFDTKLIGELQHPEKFRKFFGENNRWGTIQEKLSENTFHFQEVLTEFELLYQEAMYVRNNCDSHDEEVHLFLARLSAMITRVKNPAPHDSERLGNLLQFAWTMFAQWNHADGDLGEDVIQKMIDMI